MEGRKEGRKEGWKEEEIKEYEISKNINQKY